MQLRAAFSALICSQELNMADHLDQYKSSTYKMLGCVYCNSTHLVLLKNWKEFLEQAQQPDVPQQVQNEFIHCAYSQLALRAHYAPLIESSSYWSFVVPLFIKQKQAIESFKAELSTLNLDALTPTQKEDLVAVSCPSGEEGIVAVSELESYLKDLEMKAEFAGLLGQIPSIVYAHAETLLSLNMREEQEAIARRPLINPVHKLEEEFYSEFCTETSKVTVYTEVESLIKVSLISCVRCNSFHFIPTVKLDSVRSEVARLTKNRPERKTSFSYDIRRQDMDTSLLPLLEASPLWINVEDAMEELAQLEYEYHQSSASSVGDSEETAIQRQKYVSRLTETQLTVAAQLQALPALLNTIGTKQIKKQVSDSLRKMNQLNGSKTITSVPLSKNQGTLIVPVDEFTDEEMAVFYVCGRKNGYHTESEASAALFLDGNAFTSKEVYACSHCSKYHYGTPPKRTHTTKDYAASGRYFYVRFPRKANRYAEKLESAK